MPEPYTRGTDEDLTNEYIVEALKFQFEKGIAKPKEHSVLCRKVNIKSAVEWLKQRLCEGNFHDLDGNDVDCKFSLKKQSYNKRKCDKCRIIDKAFEGVMEDAERKE